MKKLRSRFERFCLRHRDVGIPNLMLYIVLGNALVILFTDIGGNGLLYQMLRFDRARILRGEVWRLFTYPLTHSAGNLLLTAISLVCYYSLGRSMEHLWGTLRFNLYYLTGMLLMDVFCMIFGGYATVTYLNLSLFLGYATLYPDAQFLFLFIIPIRARFFALFYLAIALFDVISIPVFPYRLYPLIALANYFLFFGKDVLNVFPLSWRTNFSRLFRKHPKQKPIPFTATHESVKTPYTHRCTVCGRTDASNPELEFRYCSRCRGYYCYCQDHINNHTHIQ